MSYRDKEVNGWLNRIYTLTEDEKYGEVGVVFSNRREDGKWYGVEVYHDRPGPMEYDGKHIDPDSPIIELNRSEALDLAKYILRELGE